RCASPAHSGWPRCAGTWCRPSTSAAIRRWRCTERLEILQQEVGEQLHVAGVFSGGGAFVAGARWRRGGRLLCHGRRLGGLLVTDVAVFAGIGRLADDDGGGEVLGRQRLQLGGREHPPEQAVSILPIDEALDAHRRRDAIGDLLVEQRQEVVL